MTIDKAFPIAKPMRKASWTKRFVAGWGERRHAKGDIGNRSGRTTSANSMSTLGGQTRGSTMAGPPSLEEAVGVLALQRAELVPQRFGVVSVDLRRSLPGVQGAIACVQSTRLPMPPGYGALENEGESFT
jgi:hypothetical protein